MTEKVYSIIEVSEQDGKWEYSDINFSAAPMVDSPGSTAGSGAPTTGSPGSGAGPVWRETSPMAVAGSGLAAAGSQEDDRRVFYQDLSGSVVETVYEPSLPDGRWVGYHVFTTEISAPSAGVGSALAVAGRLGDLRVYYFDGGRRLVRLEERGQKWTYAVCADAPRGLPISPLTALVTERGEYAYYLDGAGHLVEVSWLGVEGWSVSEVTAGVEGCPVPSTLSRLTAAGYGTGMRLVHFLDERNHPIQLEHAVIAGTKKDPEGGALWQARDLAGYGAPAVAAGSQPAVELTADGHPRLHYLDADRMVVEVGFNGRGWEVNHVGADADDGAGAPAAAAGSSLATVAQADRAATRVYYLGAADCSDDPRLGDNQLIELRGAGDKWTSRDLGAELGLPDVATGVPSPFAAICTIGPRVYYTSEE
ncbi:hypothetical protein [Kitasatospora kifunensis]|uniref:Fucose-specific lectin n=1 Tax=Kitasatospora kifunensis TaxID=58351 RepID=A0A7W7R9U6_KITKI|nr:hypothetical protein [Kitasatospora kifunensis]MBB4927979.1 hypothetical protein [Kitasatospora kifunensis]